MLVRCVVVLAWFAVLVTDLGAQRTWVVDAAGGGDFTDIPPALAVAVHGDTILVRPGSYTGGTTDQGLRLVGGPGVQLGNSPPFVVRGLPVGRTFVMTGFNEGTSSPPTRVEGCRGRVHLQRIGRLVLPPPFFVIGSPLSVRDSAGVTVHECGFAGRPGAAITASAVTVTSSLIVGLLGASRGHPGIAAARSEVFVADTLVVGANGEPLTRIPAGEGYRGVDSQLRVCGGRVVGGELRILFPIYAVDFHTVGGSVVADPNVGRGAGARHLGTGSFVERTVPCVTAPSVAPGAVIAPVWSGHLGAPSLLAISLPAPPLPTPWGALWLDPASLVVLYVGPAVASPPGITLTPAFVPGVAVTLQGIVAAPNEIVLTNAQTIAVR